MHCTLCGFIIANADKYDWGWFTLCTWHDWENWQTDLVTHMGLDAAAVWWQKGSDDTYFARILCCNRCIRGRLGVIREVAVTGHRERQDFHTMLRNASRAIIDDLQHHGGLVTAATCAWIRNNGQDIGFSIKGDRPRMEGKGKTKGDHARTKGKAPIPFQPTRFPPAPPGGLLVRRAPSTLQHELQAKETIERRDAAFQAWLATYGTPRQDELMSLVGSGSSSCNMPGSRPVETIDLLGLDMPLETPAVMTTPIPLTRQDWTDTMVSQSMSSQVTTHANPPASIEVTQTPLPSETQAEELDVNTSSCNKIRQD